MPQRVFIAYTDEGPITVDIDGKQFRVHAIEVKPVKRDENEDEVLFGIPLRTIRPKWLDQYELILKIRPEQDGTAFKVIINDQEVPLDAIKFNDGIGIRND